MQNMRKKTPKSSFSIIFCDYTHRVTTDGEKARRVWAGLEKRLSKEPAWLIVNARRFNRLTDGCA